METTDDNRIKRAAPTPLLRRPGLNLRVAAQNRYVAVDGRYHSHRPKRVQSMVGSHNADETKKVSLDMPVWQIDSIEASGLNRAEYIRAAVSEKLGGGKDSAIEARIKQREATIEKMEAECSTLERRIQEYNASIEADKRKLNSDEYDADTLNNELDVKMDMLEESETHLFPDHPDIKQIASEHDIEPVKVMNELCVRAVEQSRPIPLSQFYEGFARPPGVDDAPDADELTVDEMDDWEVWSYE